MTNKPLRAFATIIVMVGAYITSAAQIPEGYYDSLKGKKGAELKNAVYNIIKDANVLSYGSGYGKTWWGFWQTDRTEDGRFIDRYSPESIWPQSTSQGAVGAGMNIEHSFPKSWWGKTENQAYKDLYNLMPCESKINSSKSNYPMGKVVNASIADNGATKVGKGSDGKNYWEPADEWKGDFARGYMYMATCYKDLKWTGAGLQILQQGDYPTLQKWAYELFISWAKADKPTQLEITRNNAVSKIQGNRNPYVDFPNLMEYVWGDSIDYAFDPAHTECSENYSGSDTPIGPSEETIKEYVFTQDDGGFTTETTTCPEGKTIWKLKNEYGWVGSSYFGSMQEGDARLVSPEIDLSEYAKVTMSFEHAANKMNDVVPKDKFSVEIRCDGNTSIIDSGLIKWPKGTSWTYNGSGDIPLNDYAGKKIQIVFHYTGNTESAGTWEIKNLHIKGIKNTASISAATLSDGSFFNGNASDGCYSIDGQRISAPAAYRGIMIMKQGGKTWKVAK